MLRSIKLSTSIRFCLFCCYIFITLQSYASGFQVDNITELTTNNGINIEGITHIDSKLGVGTSTPSSSLHLYSTFSEQPFLIEHQTSGYIGITLRSSVKSWCINNTTMANNGIAIWDIENNCYRFVVDGSSGNTGISTREPKYKLDVDGSIRATGSVYYGGTDGSTDGNLYTKPDYVFKEDYNLLSIDKVEIFINKERHLPWITSAKQEKKDNNNLIDMTRMSFEVVETVENLQLQIIELTKIIDEQQKQISELKNF